MLYSDCGQSPRSNSGGCPLYLFWELIPLNCKECTRWKTCDIKEKPPANCGRYQKFIDANSPIANTVKVFDYLDKEIRTNKAVVGPL